MNKKVSDSRKRLIELMEYYNINQTELCKRTGLQKSALSNYLNGDREPRQSQISLIADPFNINPAWLMGYDVPMQMPVLKPNEPNINLNEDFIEKAMELYKAYTEATSDIQQAVGLLLKTTKPLADTAKKMQENVVPYLQGMQLDVEFPRKKKDKDK